MGPLSSVRLALLTLAFATAAAAADTGQTGGWAYDLTHELLSPYGSVRHSIADCPSATGIVEWVVEQERQGRGRDEVEVDLYTRFGEVLRPTPRAEGFGLAAYVVPIVLAIVGAALLALFLRIQVRARPKAPAAGPPLSPMDPELERLVDEELRR